MSVREVKKTAAGLEYQTELLSKEVKRLRRNLTSQIGKFDSLIQGTEARQVRLELEKLKAIFLELSGVSIRLCSLLSKEDSEPEEEALKLDAENVQKIDKAVEDWLKTKEGMQDDKRSVHPAQGIRYQQEQDWYGEEDGRRGVSEDKRKVENSGMGVMIRLMKKCTSLENQAGICDDLIAVNDTQMLKGEVRRLKQLHKDVSKLAQDVGSGLQREESYKVESIMNRINRRVKETLLVAEEIVPAGDTGSVSSLVSNRSHFSVFSESKVGKISKGMKAWKNDAMSLRSEPGKHRSGKFNLQEEGRYCYDNEKRNTEVDQVQKMKEELRNEFMDTRKMLGKEVQIVRSLIEHEDTQGLAGKLDYLQELQRKRDKPVFVLYQLLSDDGAIELAETVTGDDEEVRVVKELSIRLFQEWDERERRLFQGVVHKSAMSVCSSKESLTNSSIRSTRIRKRVKESENSKKLKPQTDNLRVKFSNLQDKYDEQKKTCKELIHSNNQMMSINEVQKLEESYQTMAAVAVRLREQLPSIEADDMDLQIDQEEAEVFEVKKQMIKRMTRDDRQGGLKESESQGLETKVDKKVVETEERSDLTERMKRDMERLKIRLDNQKELIDDLLQTKDQEMIKRELQTLDKVYDDYVAAVVHVRDEASANEGCQI